jgi:hypothetical protein
MEADTCNGKGLSGEQCCRSENDFEFHTLAPRMFALETN